MKKLTLFDNIKYKYIKYIINNDYENIEVDIEDFGCGDENAWKGRFHFGLDVGNRILKFDLEKKYNWGSPGWDMMIDLYYITSDTE